MQHWPNRTFTQLPGPLTPASAPWPSRRGYRACSCASAHTSKNPWHWVPAADSVHYLGLKLQPDREFSLQRKHRLRLAAVHHWCLNTLAPPKVVQDVILAILGGITQ